MLSVKNNVVDLLKNCKNVIQKSLWLFIYALAHSLFFSG